MPRQFSLRSLFVLTAVVAVGCLVRQALYETTVSIIIAIILCAPLLLAVPLTSERYKDRAIPDGRDVSDRASPPKN
jgi:hypothetical protein